jgi:two-component sensor histidine kinase
MFKIFTCVYLFTNLLTLNIRDLNYIKRLNDSFISTFSNLEWHLSKVNTQNQLYYSDNFVEYYFCKDVVYKWRSNKEYSEKSNYSKEAEKRKYSNRYVKYRMYSFLVVSILLIIVSIVLSFTLYFLSRRKKKSKLIILKHKELVKLKRNVDKKLEVNKVLLSEVHHRVKNNFQIVISLLNIEARRNQDITIEDFLEKAEARIGAIAAIHESLSEHNNEERVFLHKYLRKLSCNIIKLSEREDITVFIDTNDISCSTVTSVSLGLIVNELLCNALEHAFQVSAKGEIVIDIMVTSDGDYSLIFSDDGFGNSCATKSKNSLGLYLVNMLVMQIGGTLKIIESPGLTYEICFKDNLKI